MKFHELWFIRTTSVYMVNNEEGKIDCKCHIPMVKTGVVRC